MQVTFALGKPSLAMPSTIQSTDVALEGDGFHDAARHCIAVVQGDCVNDVHIKTYLFSQLVNELVSPASH